jgi:hypothetical protein
VEEDPDGYDYMVMSIVRIAGMLGADFVPYLQFVLPLLYQHANKEVRPCIQLRLCLRAAAFCALPAVRVVVVQGWQGCWGACGRVTGVLPRRCLTRSSHSLTRFSLTTPPPLPPATPPRRWR